MNKFSTCRKAILVDSCPKVGTRTRPFPSLDLQYMIPTNSQVIFVAGENAFLQYSKDVLFLYFRCFIDYIKTASYVFNIYVYIILSI